VSERPEGAEIVGIGRKRGKKGDIIALLLQVLYPLISMVRCNLRGFPSQALSHLHHIRHMDIVCCSLTFHQVPLEHP